jgi:hypothetical protein
VDFGLFRACKLSTWSVVVCPPVSLPCTHPDIAKSKPKPWRDAGEEVRGLFYHDAMRGMPNVRAFTLCLTADVQRHAKAQGKHCLRWLHKRVVRQLGHTGGAPTPFWFAIEESDKGELHAHGELVVLPEKEKAVRSTLKSAGGKWDRDGTQLRFSKAAPDFRWAGYCLKSVHKARPERRRWMRRYGSPRRWVAGFEGKAVTASEGLRRLALRLHCAACCL